MQKYPHIIKLYACILLIFVAIFLLPITSLGICSTSKLLKYVALSPLTYKDFQSVLFDF